MTIYVHYEGADRLERPTREQEEGPDLLVRELHLTAGMSVADVGAGSGYLSKRMAAMVFPGKALAVDVQPQMVEMLRALSGQAATRRFDRKLQLIQVVMRREGVPTLGVG